MRIEDILCQLPLGRQPECRTHQDDCGQSLSSESDSSDAVVSSITPAGDQPSFPTVTECLCAEVDPSCLFSYGETLRASLHGASAFWTAAVVYFDSLEAVQAVCWCLDVPAGLGCKVWTFVDDQSARWIAVFLVGIIGGFEVEASQVKAEDFFSLYGGLGLASSLVVNFVQLIPWWEYRQWRRNRSFLLDASLWVWEDGEDIDSLESRFHCELDALISNSL